MKNTKILQCWEHFVQQYNQQEKPWKAKQSHRICSNHFQLSDYVIPPSSNGTCRLKKYAKPSQPVPSNTTRCANIPDELHNRIDPLNKRPASSTNFDNPEPPAKIAKMTPEEKRDELHHKLEKKIRNLQQQLRRTKQRAKTMSEVIKILQEKLIINSKEAESLQNTFESTHLDFLYNFKNNLGAKPSGRRYTDEIKEFALTLYYYSPKAYKYVRSIVPLPNPSLIKKWSASFKCEPGFVEEAFTSLSKEITHTPSNKDCCLVIDAMSIRKQTIWNPQKDQYSGFVDLGGVIPNEQTTKLASEALVFLLVGTRSHWKCPIGFFLVDKINAKDQASLVNKSLEKAAEVGLKVWSVTADGTAVNLKTFEILGCNFCGNYDDMKTTFTHPTTGEEVYVILDPCHMLKLACNAMAHHGSFVDDEGHFVQWKYVEELQKLQAQEGLTLANKLSSNHLKFQKHKMNVRLAAHTLSSSVANAIAFMDTYDSTYSSRFAGSAGTVKFIRVIDKLFDMLNSRNPWGKGFKAPLRLKNKDTWQESFLTSAEYLLSLKTTTGQLLSTSSRKTFVIGFVTCIKSTISMATKMFNLPANPFTYLLTYKYSQDHLELLFSCIRSRGGWNNNPNCLQLQYSLRKMLMRNAVTASKNANCVDFTGCNSIIPIFHTRKHRTSPINTETTQEKISDESMNNLCEQFHKEGHSEFIANVLFYISGYIVSKLIDHLPCPACKQSLLPLPKEIPVNGHDYTASLYHQAGKASAFTTYINNGGLQIPSTSVFRTVEYCEHLFKAMVTGKDGNLISNECNLKQKMIVKVCHHFVLDSTIQLFPDHGHSDTEILVEEDHITKLIKFIADKYFTIRLFNFGKKYIQEIENDGKPSDRHRLNKLVLFNNQ